MIDQCPDKGGGRDATGSRHGALKIAPKRLRQEDRYRRALTCFASFSSPQ
ncbi:hypothetical protein ABIC32_001766 [Brevundimonas sp. 1080]